MKGHKRKAEPKRHESGVITHWGKGIGDTMCNTRGYFVQVTLDKAQVNCKLCLGEAKVGRPKIKKLVNEEEAR